MIEIKNLYLNYIKEYYALYNINLVVEDKQKIAIVGNLESGKTTLLRAICGLEAYSKGEIYLNKTNLKNIDFKKDIDLIYLSANPVFFNNKTVHYNLSYPLKLRGFSEELINKKINRALNNLGIEGLKEEKIKKLSENEKSIVNIARSLLRDADIYLIDDIFKFDEITNKKIAKVFQENFNPDASIIYALNSTNQNLIENLQVSKTYTLTNGSLSNY